MSRTYPSSPRASPRGNSGELTRGAVGLLRPWVADLHPAQREPFESTERFRALLCGRRAGKSDLVGRWLVDGAIVCPGSLQVFIGLRSTSAKRTIWEVLRALDARWGLGVRWREDELTGYFANGSRIWVAGCDDESEVGKFRGPTPSYYRVAIDEAEAFRGHIASLVNDALTPALADFDGEIMVNGTPGAACAGWFHAITTGGNEHTEPWRTWRWTALDNPHVKARALFDEILRRNRWTEDHPTFRREYLGQWVRDEDALVYPYSSARNAIVALDPAHVWRYMLAVDVGFVDATAFAIVAYSPTCKQAVAVRSWKRAGMAPSEVADAVGKIRSSTTLEKVIWDTGGIGKGYAEEARIRLGLPVCAAEKGDKIAFVRHMADDIRRGCLRVIEADNRALIEEMAILQWDTDRVKLDDRYEDHLCDALLYAWRDCAHYLVDDPLPAEPEQGSPEWADKHAADIRRGVLAQLNSKKEWWRR